MKRLPYREAPCSNCPFRKDSLKGWLGKERIQEILVQSSFVCHKTTRNNKTRLQCAGHMVLRRNGNIFFELANRLDANFSLSGGDIVFQTESQCIEHHKK